MTEKQILKWVGNNHYEKPSFVTDVAGPAGEGDNLNPPEKIVGGKENICINSPW